MWHPFVWWMLSCILLDFSDREVAIDLFAFVPQFWVSPDLVVLDIELALWAWGPKLLANRCR